MSRTTMKEAQKAIDKNQLASYVESLVSAINAASDFNLVLVESDSPWFEVSVEYPPYHGPEKFQRRISAHEAWAIAGNIHYNIKELFGYDYDAKQIHVYRLSENAYPRPAGEFYDSRYREPIIKGRESDAIVMYKKLYIKIGFVEKPSW